MHLILKFLNSQNAGTLLTYYNRIFCSCYSLFCRRLCRSSSSLWTYYSEVLVDSVIDFVNSGSFSILKQYLDN